ncbi:cytochrome P450 3A9-like isoform X1 [Protopterus annectens]|uniref:cytochrome P450 3A9-like isoform X1 n=1 Tax=Protopterus annectens TaxID=7888 RepID=UPI001CFABF5F|nr:cytochrome P450 3A9-like isoform X1 [Protopterus annectens]
MASVESWILAVAVLVILLIYGTSTFGFFKKLNIPGPRPLPFIGTFHHNRKGFFNFDLECMQKYGKVWGIFDGRTPVLVTVDTAMLKTILVKECFTIFTNRRNFGLNGKLDVSLTVVEDDHWKRIRSVLSPTFTSGRLKEMFPIIKRYRDNLIKNLQKKADAKEPVMMKEIFGAYSMDAIASTSFSVDLDSLNNPNDPFVINIKKALKFTIFNPLFLIAVMCRWLVPLLEKFEFSMFPSDVTEFFSQVVQQIKSKRNKGDRQDRVDFLQLMIDTQTSMQSSELSGLDYSKKGEGTQGLTDREILAQSILFIFAGYETTSSALSFLSYILAIHPDIQTKLQQEIDEQFPDKGQLTYDGLMQMEYLDMVINESLRIYPNGGRLERVCKKTVDVNGVTIPKGTVVMIPLYALHRDPQHWPEPEEFRPERFTKENKETRDQYAHLPFGTGPRNCIGMRFALLNVKLAITSILQNFTFVPCKETPIPLELDPKGFMTPKKPIVLSIIPRKSTEE